MTETEKQTFVDAFAAAWAARDGAAFLALWHPDGVLHYPFARRLIRGREIGKLNDFLKVSAPHLTWRLIDWTTRGDVIVVEWENTTVIGGEHLAWRGVDKFTLRDGRIIEEIVYSDTAPLQALRLGRTFDALVDLPEDAAA